MLRFPYPMPFIPPLGRDCTRISLQVSEGLGRGILFEAPVDVIVVEVKVEGYEGGR
jgi:hypothetical protein